MPFESEFIIRYKGRGKADLNRIYISSKTKAIRIATALTTEQILY